MQNNKTFQDSAVLLITFNRPSYTKEVLKIIKKAEITKLYIFNDAPRENNLADKKAREEIRKIIKQIDWRCNVQTFFAEKNLGCGPGPVQGISWIFKHEDKAIILEDDCVPSIRFFDYCNELLEKYKNDTRIWTISGNNFHEEIEIPYSYIFSYLGQSSGWATWKRCWKEFDHKMSYLDEFLKIGGFNNLFYNNEMSSYFNQRYQTRNSLEGYEKHAWDFQANFMVKSNGGLSIIPAKNLVENIGIQGTHSSKELSYHNRKTDNSFTINKHPKFVIPYFKYDEYCFKKHYQKHQRFHQKILKKLKKIFLNNDK
jgi:hypothetical protein